MAEMDDAMLKTSGQILKFHLGGHVGFFRLLSFVLYYVCVIKVQNIQRLSVNELSKLRFTFACENREVSRF
jgi:hypothetical protein